MPFFVLDPQRDRDKWDHLVSRLPEWVRDMHLSSRYMDAQRLLGHQPRLACYTYENYFIVLPIIVRDIDISTPSGLWRDVSSPYGYGGPYSNHGHTLYRWFDEAFLMWCRDNRIVTEFCALHPLKSSHQVSLLKGASDIKTVVRKQVVYLDLASDYASKYHDNRRQGIAKARKAGVVVSATSSPEKFITLYGETMERQSAAQRWYFPPEYLRELAGIGTVLQASYMGVILSTALVLILGDKTAYYHFAANSMDFPKVCANDLLLDEIAKFAAGAGCTRLHLGGGVTSAPDDSVLFFKGGFSGLRATASSYYRVINPSAFQELCAAKVAQEIDQTGAEFTTSFQPMYRREVV